MTSAVVLESLGAKEELLRYLEGRFAGWLRQNREQSTGIGRMVARLGRDRVARHRHRRDPRRMEWVPVAIAKAKFEEPIRGFVDPQDTSPVMADGA